jgi:hypothetical protein
MTAATKPAAEPSTTNVYNASPAPAGQGQIAAALAEFQKNIPTPAKDSEASIPTKNGGSYGYDYASLDKLTPVILPALAAQGIAYTAAPDWTEIGFGLRAELIHVSGEKISGFYPLGSPTNPAQVIGSAITYARRYALLSLTGVAPGGEDDDGASASKGQAETVAAAAAKAEPPKETAKSIREEMGNTIDANPTLLSTGDANTIMKETVGEKAIGEWNVTDMKKARLALNKLLTERKAAAEAK